MSPAPCRRCCPGEDIKFAEPADVGGSYEAYQYRQQLALFAALGIPYSLATSDLATRELLVAARLHRGVPPQAGADAAQHHRVSDVHADLAALDGHRSSGEAIADRRQPTTWQSRRTTSARSGYRSATIGWTRCKDRQAEKLAVEAGFKSRSDVIEAEGSDPEENDKRIAADQGAREARWGWISAKPSIAVRRWRRVRQARADDDEEAGTGKQDAEEADDAAAA